MNFFKKFWKPRKEKVPSWWEMRRDLDAIEDVNRQKVEDMRIRRDIISCAEWWYITHIGAPVYKSDGKRYRFYLFVPRPAGHIYTVYDHSSAKYLHVNIMDLVKIEFDRILKERGDPTLETDPIRVDGDLFKSAYDQTSK